ncbi:hypothetical protein P879_04276 [Paragonimus westermani]|uniref:Neurofascin/L1/NrCAM C-terminal domain-containing protein n=1 Tax=Paragonimus westermani TaxID=34504 RepID=A0A8T0DP56_9TREM|nr:hypothetical protein P879_04276 [Paragonimus westermani]
MVRSKISSLMLTLSVWTFIQSGLFASGKEQFLRFIPTVPLHEQRLYYKSPATISPIEVDATSPQQVRIQILDFLNHNPELKLHCRVAPLDENSEIIAAELCKTSHASLSNVDCIDPKYRTPQFGEIRFNAIGNQSHGYTFHSELPVGKVLLDALYFCKFRNKRGKLISNMVEIQDVYYYQKKMVNRKVQPERIILPPLNSASLPLRLECGVRDQLEPPLPIWADNSFPSPFRWSFCDLTNPDKATPFDCMNRVREAPIRVSEYFEHMVFTNGTLVLFQRTTAAWKNMGLLCWSHLLTSSIFSVYFGGTESKPGTIVYDSRQPYPQQHGIQALSPTSQSIIIRKGPTSGLILVASYRARMTSTTTQWSKDGEPISFDFPVRTAFTLAFPEVILRNHSGTYVLKVQDQTSNVYFRFEVSVIGPPEVVRHPPELLLVMEGNEASFSCLIEGARTTSLLINGVEFPRNSFPHPKELTEQFPHLKDALIHPLDIRDSGLHYRASNLVFTPGSPFGPTHMVTIAASNPYGSAFVSTFVNVLPRPKVIVSPSKFSCRSPCPNTMEYTFDCKLDLAPYQMAYVNQTWDWDGTDVGTLRQQGDARALYLTQDGTQLRLMPVFKPQHVDLFSNSNVTCRLRIYDPVVLEPATSSSSEFAYTNPKWTVYDSRNDPLAQTLLTAQMNLMVEVKPESMNASISWIAVVIIVISILIIIAVLVACVVMRTRGETYLLDKEERAWGIDPVKDLCETEAFRTYERAEEPPLRGSRCSLNDDSAEIGSDADGELDDYNLDPGKFNEEGSFIDQYTTDTHYKGTPRLPTLSRSYDPHL